ncbi:outer membrane beta-barrel protein [Gemmatimonas sp.]|jgi:hypothetical protein|uniref:outer membrane beta-barrel protein n=1 Tax=Gemmatimonas sp. TaxID=1962908 RepID=UPI0037C0DE8F
MTRSLRPATTATMLLAGLGLAHAAHAQSGSTKGLFAGIQYSGTSVSVRSAAQDLEFGNGFGLHAGLGLSDNVSVLVNFDRSVLTGSDNAQDVKLTQYDALLRFNVLPGAGSPLRLFVTAGATGRTANAGRDFDGIAPTGGAGVHLYVTPKIALNGTALWTFGNLTRASQISNRTDETFRSTATRVQAGVSLYLFSR